MSKDFYIELTLAVHKVTELFPENESLKYDIRNLANEILVDLINSKFEECSQAIENIKNLINLAEAQNWVDSRNFLVLKREYGRIKKLAKKELISSGKTVEKFWTTKERKEKILDVLKEKKKIQLRELIQDFPQVSKRTLIRDLEDLYQAGEIVRIGNGRASFYKNSIVT